MPFISQTSYIIQNTS